MEKLRNILHCNKKSSALMILVGLVLIVAVYATRSLEIPQAINILATIAAIICLLLGLVIELLTSFKRDVIDYDG